MDAARLVLWIALGEGAMLLFALAAAWWAQVPLALGAVAPGLAFGAAGALALALANLALLRARVDIWPGRSLRHVCQVVVRPLFQQVSVRQIAIVSLLAGVGEELLFRGVLLPLIGLPASSVLFGAVHIGGRSFLGFGAWAACIGALFGWLMVTTGGLLAPIVAHAVYDALALAYVRFGPTDVCET